MSSPAPPPVVCPLLGTPDASIVLPRTRRLKTHDRIVADFVDNPQAGDILEADRIIGDGGGAQ